MLKHSVKNLITIENNTIKKSFSDEQDFFTEYHFYQEYKDFPYIPKLIKVENNTLYLEYIKGKSLYETKMTEQLRLAKTLAEFHNYYPLQAETEKHCLSLTHHDTNLHNYIHSQDKIYMLDFSDIIIDHPLSDVYSALLFFCELYPHEMFFGFIKKFYEIYFGNIKHDIMHSSDILQKEILRFEERRAKRGKCIYNYQFYLKNKHTMINNRLSAKI